MLPDKKTLQTAELLKMSLDNGDINIHAFRSFLEIIIAMGTPKPISNKDAGFLKHLKLIRCNH